MQKKKVDNGHRRHKCSWCGRVRLEKFMQMQNSKTRWQNYHWKCADVLDDEHDRLNPNNY